MSWKKSFDRVLVFDASAVNNKGLFSFPIQEGPNSNLRVCHHLKTEEKSPNRPLLWTLIGNASLRWLPCLYRAITTCLRLPFLSPRRLDSQDHSPSSVENRHSPFPCHYRCPCRYLRLLLCPFQRVIPSRAELLCPLEIGFSNLNSYHPYHYFCYI